MKDIKKMDKKNILIIFNIFIISVNGNYLNSTQTDYGIICTSCQASQITLNIQFSENFDIEFHQAIFTIFIDNDFYLSRLYYISDKYEYYIQKCHNVNMTYTITTNTNIWYNIELDNYMLCTGWQFIIAVIIIFSIILIFAFITVAILLFIDKVFNISKNKYQDDNYKIATAKAVDIKLEV